MRRRAVLLDALGTLVKLEPPVPRLQRALIERLGLPVTEADARRAIAQEITYYRAHLNEGRDQSSLRELRRRCAEVLWSELPAAGPMDTDAVVEALLASLHFTAFPDAEPVLRALTEDGLRLVVVSNWDISLADVLERLDLSRWLDGVVTSAGVGARKPRPEVFLQALALAEADPGEAVHVGDSLQEDVMGARGAGIEAVWLVREGTAESNPPGPEVSTIRTLRELPGLVSR
ncbi:MAG TPA: HAD family hydrolase [Solirubrobacteraceae bacterium]|nr:HAD family hydrolase [Solirubrobacteraceae bacterium]